MTPDWNALTPQQQQAVWDQHQARQAPPPGYGQAPSVSAVAKPGKALAIVSLCLGLFALVITAAFITAGSGMTWLVLPALAAIVCGGIGWKSSKMAWFGMAAGLLAIVMMLLL